MVNLVISSYDKDQIDENFRFILSQFFNGICNPPAGMEEEQGMCVLAPNVMNQYLFLIFWFALVFTIFSNTFSIFFSVSTHCCIDGGYQRFIQSCFLKENSKLKFIYFNCGTTGRTYLHLIAKNVNPRIFEQLIIKLSADLVEEKNKQHLKGSKDIPV